jgi:uncharacterized protein
MTEPPIAPELLEIIVCPACHGDLRQVPDAAHPSGLHCTNESCGLRYPVRDGIPVLLVDEADRG